MPTQTLIHPPFPEPLQKPFFYDKAIYAVAKIRDEIATARFTINASGEAQDFAVLHARTKVHDCHDSLATCVYKGKPYLFFDSAKQDNRWRFHIRYKTAASLDKGWSPVDPHGLDTGLSGSYANWGHYGSPPAISAQVLGDKIFLFYYRDDAMYYATFDGTAFAEIGKLFDRYHPHHVTATATRAGQPVIVFGGVHLDDDKKIRLATIDAAGKVIAEMYVYLDWAQHNNMFGLAHGSIPGAQGNVLQLFANNSGDASKGLRRASIDVESLTAGAFADTGILSKAKPYAFCDVAVAAVQDGMIGNFRQHMVVLSTQDPDYNQTLVNAYPSDFFQVDHQGVADTKDSKTEEPGAWTLLGVVEGVPPFTRNDVKSSEATSSVIYGEGDSRKVTVAQTHETSLTSSLGIGVDKTFGISAELAHTFATTNELSRTITREVEITMSNDMRNNEGVNGWLLVSKPQIQGRRYTRFTQDRTRELGKFNVAAVKNVSIGIETYKLTQPRLGMTPRKESTDLTYWQKTGVPADADIVEYSINALTATLDGGVVKSSLKITNSERRSSASSFTVVLKHELTLKEIFNVSGSDGYTYTSAMEVTSEFSQNISASLRLLDPKVDEAIVTELVVTPIWLVPRDGAKLDAGKLPFWVAKEFARNGIIPWCLTWKVNSIKHENRFAAAQRKS